jgi:hypothetical protein
MDLKLILHFFLGKINNEMAWVIVLTSWEETTKYPQ